MQLKYKDKQRTVHAKKIEMDGACKKLVCKYCLQLTCTFSIQYVYKHRRPAVIIIYLKR